MNVKNKGFTLIELLVVVAIIGILAAVGVISYNNFTISAKISSAKAYHNQVTKAIKLDFFNSCEIQQKNLTNGAGIFCNLTGVDLAQAISTSPAEKFGLNKNLLNPNNEAWIMYSSSSNLNTNIINAKNKVIGRLYIYDIKNKCFGFITTLGDDQPVIREEFCFN